MSIPIIHEGTVKHLYTQEEVDALMENAGSGSSDSSNERNFYRIHTVTSKSPQRMQFDLLELMTIDESDLNNIKTNAGSIRVTQPGEETTCSDAEITKKDGVIAGVYIWATIDPTKPTLFSCVPLDISASGFSSYKYNTLLISQFLDV